jgi:hypothetical protein
MDVTESQNAVTHKRKLRSSGVSVTVQEFWDAVDATYAFEAGRKNYGSNSRPLLHRRKVKRTREPSEALTPPQPRVAIMDYYTQKYNEYKEALSTSNSGTESTFLSQVTTKGIIRH